MCNWVTMLYRRKLTEHCKPGRMGKKNKSHYIKTKKIKLKKRKRQMPYDITYIWNLIYGTNEPLYRKEAKSWTLRTDMWLPRGKGKGLRCIGSWG